MVNGNKCSLKEDKYLQEAIEYLSNAVEDDNWIDLSSPSGPGVFDDLEKSVEYLESGRASNVGSDPGQCSLDATNFITDITEAAMNLAKDAIACAECGGNAAYTNELRKAKKYFEGAKEVACEDSIQITKKPGRRHTRF